MGQYVKCLLLNLEDLSLDPHPHTHLKRVAQQVFTFQIRDFGDRRTPGACCQPAEYLSSKLSKRPSQETSCGVPEELS